MGVKLFYLKPHYEIIGKEVGEGQLIGWAQDISIHYGLEGKMTPHIHVEIDSIDIAMLIKLSGG